MKYILIILLLSVPCIKLQAQVNIITTIAGTGVSGYCCDNMPATDAQINVIEGLCLDKFNNLFIADGFNNRIRKVNLSTGIITTIAGNGNANYSGDNGPATNAELFVPEAVSADTFGNIYIADAGNNRIRKITVSTGIITTVAGNGMAGATGDGFPATLARLNKPTGVFVDKTGNIFIADYDNKKIRKVDATSNNISTIAGTGVTGNYGDGGPATNARLNGPIQIFLDNASNVYICDQMNHAVRKVDAVTEIITTVAGSGSIGYFGDGNLATNANLNEPLGVYVDELNNLFIADYQNGAIRKVDAITKIITTVAGTGIKGYSGDGGPATNAQLKCGYVFLDSYGQMFIADMYNSRVRKVYNPYLAVPKSIVENDYELYPNPASSEITIASSSSLLTNATMTMYDVVGKVVMERKLNSTKETIDISALNNGVYVVQVYDAEHKTLSMTKLVVVR